MTWDVAASPENTVVDGGRFFSLASSAFDADFAALFSRRDLLFLNPTFGTIASEWAPLVARWTRKLPWLRLLMLTPASVGSEWFQTHVHRRALVLALSPRLTFVGAEDPYPKDCMLSCFGFGVGFDVWRWDETLEPAPPVKARAPAKRLRDAALIMPA